MTGGNRLCTSGPWPDASPGEALEARTALVEAAVLEAWGKFLAPACPEGVAVLAAGGFGRRELFPFSDVDLVVLVERPHLAERQREHLSAFLQELWDRGLRVSHSVRTVAECGELDERNVELAVSLLDQRYLAGDRGLHARLVPALARLFHRERGALARWLCRMARERHAAQGATICQLEPNVKESPGGLRDYHLGGWLRGLRSAQPERPPRSDPDPELAAARDFLFAVRCHLHARAGRDSNHLTFDLQEELAEQCGQAPAAWMRGYYGHAREIHHAALREMESASEQAGTLLAQFWDWRSRVSNADFYVSRERVYFRAPHRLEFEPPLAPRLFQFVARHGLALAADTERRLHEHLPRLRRYFAETRVVWWPALRELLSAPHHAPALRAMHRTGVLAAMFPEWEGIDCLVVRDFYHRYTVDEHSLTAIEALADLRGCRDPSRRRFAELLSEIDQPALLALALLFHDTGKAGPPGAHVRESVRLAESAMERIHVPAEERRTVRFLIERHLELSAVMASRDLDDPATAGFLAERAATLELLKKLVLITYADISAVNPAAMTPWRTEQLWRVYLVANRELTRELEEARLPASPQQAEFLEGLPVRYLRIHTEAEIASHLALAERSRARGVALDIGRTEGGLYRLTLVALDRPALLASIAGALAGFGMEILKAEGFANRRGAILDTFVFADPHRTLELNPPEMDRLRLALERVTLGKLDVRSLLRSRPRPAPPSRRARLEPAVAFDSRISEAATLVQVTAEDRPGLLYDLASAISAAGANIELLLADTEAHKALDVFYVTIGGRKLSPAEEEAMAEKLRAAGR